MFGGLFLPCPASPFLPGTHCCFPVFHLVFPYHPIFRFIKINKQLWIYVIITLNAICSHCFYIRRFKPPYILSFLLSFFLFFYCCRYLVVTLSILCRYLVELSVVLRVTCLIQTVIIYSKYAIFTMSCDCQFTSLFKVRNRCPHFSYTQVSFS